MSTAEIMAEIAVRFAALSFVAVGMLQWPLLWVIAVLVPVALVAEWQATRVRR